VLEETIPVPPSSLKYVWMERYPIATHLVSVCATNYAHYSDTYVTLSGEDMPIEHYPYPERLGRARSSWNRLPDMMTACAQLFGEYPFVLEKYGHTMFSVPGALEHQTNTSYGRNLTDSTHYYDYMIVHELGHQWWGDEVTAATWADNWLSEGFVSYTEALWTEHQDGFEAYRNYMVTASKLGVSDPSGPVYNPSDLFNANTVYHKGAWILHMLRGLLRDDSLFFEALRYYRARHALGNATTDEFLSNVSNACGFYVTSYLHAYVYLTNRPHYAYSFGSGIVDGDWQTVVRIRQTQTDPDTTFRTRLDLRFGASLDTARVRVENDRWETRYYLSLGFEPTQLVLDPDDWVLKQATAEPFPLTILNEEPEYGALGEWYVDTLVGAAGVPPLAWSCVGGALPDGLDLSPQGVISGIPQRGDIYTALLRMQDAVGAADSMTYQFYITPFTPLPPKDLIVRLGEAGSVILTWQRSSPTDSFRVYRATLADFSDAQCIVTTADTVAVDTVASDALPGSAVLNRFYRVTAVRYP